MLAQRLRHQITIEQKSTSLNAYRENTGTWSTLRTVFAGVEPLSDRSSAAVREFAASGATVAQRRVVFVCRHEDVSDVTPQMRVVFNGQNYEIEGLINEMSRDRMVNILANTGTNRGGQ